MRLQLLRSAVLSALRPLAAGLSLLRKRFRVWAQPDPTSVRVGREGELLTAKVRLWAGAVGGLICLRAIKFTARGDIHLEVGATARILVAEDNAVNQKVVELMLARMGYQADLAENGFAVLCGSTSRRRARRGRPTGARRPES